MKDPMCGVCKDLVAVSYVDVCVGCASKIKESKLNTQPQPDATSDLEGSPQQLEVDFGVDIAMWSGKNKLCLKGEQIASLSKFLLDHHNKRLQNTQQQAQSSIFELYEKWFKGRELSVPENDAVCNFMRFIQKQQKTIILTEEDV